MAVPSMIRWVRLAAAAKTLRLSPPEALIAALTLYYRTRIATARDDLA